MTSEQFQQGRLDGDRFIIFRPTHAVALPPGWLVSCRVHGWVYGTLAWVGKEYRFRSVEPKQDEHALTPEMLREIADACFELTEITTLLLTNGYFPGKGVTS